MKRALAALLTLAVLSWPTWKSWAVPPTPELSGPGANGGGGRGMVSVGDDDGPRGPQLLPPGSNPINADSEYRLFLKGGPAAHITS